MTSSLLNKGLRLSSDSDLLIRRNECNRKKNSLIKLAPRSNSFTDSPNELKKCHSASIDSKENALFHKTVRN